MTLDEAIEHCEEVAEENECKNCAKEHRQLAEWLKELKQLREQEPCEDAISRQAAIDALRDKENHAFNSYYKGLIKAHKIIANLPPVKPVACIAKVNFSKEDMQEIVDKKVKKMVVRKKGKWINIDKTHSECDRCKSVFEIASANGESNFCPNCGADMREVEE